MNLSQIPRPLLSPVVILLILTNPGVWTSGEPVVLIDENWEDPGTWSDLSTAISWDGQPADGSAFQTPGGILSLNAAGIASVGQRPWESVERTRSFTALDYRFPEPLPHRDVHLVVEIRVRWDSMIYDLRGEWNRINLMLVHDYPEGGLDLTRDAKVFDFSEEWWGRPSYQVRIRGNDAADGTALLMYGGGYAEEGEFEIYYDVDGVTPLWWLPGFSSTAGGGTSNGGPSPGVGDPWPLNGWSGSSTGLASTNWQRFRYVVSPHEQALYVDADDDGLGWVRDGHLPLPEEADAPASAPLYHYFEEHEGIRLYLRGYDNVEMDFLRVWYYPDAAPGTMRISTADGQTRVEFHGEVGQLHDLEHSTDLVNWTVIESGIEGDGFSVSRDVTAISAGPRNFFRVRSVPVPAREGN